MKFNKRKWEKTFNEKIPERKSYQKYIECRKEFYCFFNMVLNEYEKVCLKQGVDLDSLFKTPKFFNMDNSFFFEKGQGQCLVRWELDNLLTDLEKATKNMTADIVGDRESVVWFSNGHGQGKVQASRNGGLSRALYKEHEPFILEVLRRHNKKGIGRLKAKEAISLIENKVNRTVSCNTFQTWNRAFKRSEGKYIYSKSEC